MKDLQHLFIRNTTAGTIIRAFRTNFHITQKEMSEVIGVPETNLSAIENDRREIGVDLATRIGAFLGIHPSLLLFPNGQEAEIKKHKMIIQKAKRLLDKKIRQTG
ncbi:MAG: hypothetical protein C5B49_04080 [Bdellovibrio sp.]|nr:MAG: hypothetical protein C5B49_04080 [Bdellovibrio sp.]